MRFSDTRFFVNLKTGVSQWTAPEDPADTSSDAPPSYDQSGPRKSPIPEKKSAFPSNNPYGGGSSSNPDISEDAKLAARLQAEEDARAKSASPGSRGASADYYSNQAAQSQSPQPAYGQSQSPYGQSQSPAADQGEGGQRGLLGKIFGKGRNNNNNNYGPGGGYPPQQGYGPQGGYGPPQGGYGGYPPQGNYGGYPPPGYGGYPPQGGYGYGPPPPQGYYQQDQPQRKHGGLGGMGGAALGLGGGLLAGALITDAIEDHDQQEYDQGYNQGYDQGQDNNYDDGGGFDGGDGGF